MAVRYSFPGGRAVETIERERIFARVVEPGKVSPGDAIERIS